MIIILMKYYLTNKILIKKFLNKFKLIKIKLNKIYLSLNLWMTILIYYHNLY